MPLQTRACRKSGRKPRSTVQRSGMRVSYLQRVACGVFGAQIVCKECKEKESEGRRQETECARARVDSAFAFSDQFVTCSFNRKQESRIALIELDFFAQAGNVDVHGAAESVAAEVPDFFEQFRSEEHT